MRAKVKLQGLEPVTKGRSLPFELVNGVIPWTALEPASTQQSSYFRPVLPDGTRAKIGLLPISVGDGRRSRVAMRLWRRAMKRAWESGSLEMAADFRRDHRGEQIGYIVMAAYLLVSLAMLAWLVAPSVANDRGIALAIDLVIGALMSAVLGPALWMGCRAARDTWSKDACVYAAIHGRLLDIERAHKTTESFNLGDASAVRFGNGTTVEFKDGRIEKLPRSVRFRYVLYRLRDELDPGATDRDTRELKLLFIRCWLYFVAGGVGLGILTMVAHSQGWIPQGEPKPWLPVLGLGLVFPIAMAAIWFASSVAERGWGFWRKKRRRA